MKVISATVAALLLAACSASTAASDRVPVTAAFYPLAFVAQRIGGSAVDVRNLTPPGAEPHDLELKPSDVQAIRSARVVLYLHGFQPAVDDAIGSRRAAAFDALTAIDVRRASDGSLDPHFWLDPTLLARVAAVIEHRLELLSPANAALFQKNLTGLYSQLSSLDDEFHSGLAQCSSHEIFTGHAAFAYMAARYGLEQIAITGLNPEAEPSPKQLTRIIQRARRVHPKVIYAETLLSSRSVDAVARAVGAAVDVLNPLEGLLPAQAKAGDDYFSLMRDNLQRLEEGLSCRASP
jgi:zinc transport system substrate-binding protein